MREEIKAGYFWGWNDYGKVKAPKGKFIVVKVSANNITGWEFRVMSVHSTKEEAVSASKKNKKDLEEEAIQMVKIEGKVWGRAIASQTIRVMNDCGKNA